jgi:hypothetical protein
VRQAEQTPLWNRAPLAPNAFAPLPIGAITARGWLHEQLRLSAGGLTGHMMEIWPDVGSQSGWLGGPGENWERGPYYARGLLALAYTLKDQRLIARAVPWVEWSLRSQRDDGFFGPADNDDWWPRMPMLEALRWFHDATADVRVLPFMSRYLRYQLTHLPAKPLEAWGKPRGGDNIDAALWLYNRTGEPFLLELADLLHQQTSDWIGELGGGGPPSDAFEFGHGVNRAMGFKEPAVYFQRSENPRHLAALSTGWQRTLQYHGQIQGMFSGDEFLHGRGATQGTEFCTIVELLSSFETAFTISGEQWLAGAIERIAYNALPAILSVDHCSHQYFQLPNQIECTPGGRNFHVHHETDLLFGPATGYGCCAANFHMGWPRLVNHLWLATRDNGLLAMLLAPCEVRATVGDGRDVAVTEETSYPFEDTVRFTERTAEPAAFPLSVCVPAWAENVIASVNGRRLRTAASGGLLAVARTWKDGDTLVVRLPMHVRLSQWEGGAVGVERGPLVYALRIGEQWRKVSGGEPFADYEVHPTTPWNYGLLLDRQAPARWFRVQKAPMAAQPWAQDGAPVRLRARGRRLPGWSRADGVSGPIPESDLFPGTQTERLTLIPFGCARLRISMFPVVS